MIITLTGFMLSGKSSYGIEAAKQMGWDFLDLDDEIVKSSKYNSVVEIFENEGETYFRNLETQVLENVLNIKENTIVALGGGIVESEKNRHLILKNSFCIWLLSSLDNSVYSPRFKDMLAKRPILQGKTRKDIEELYNHRLLLYREIANQTIFNDGLTDEDIINEIISIINSVYLHS